MGEASGLGDEGVGRTAPTVTHWMGTCLLPWVAAVLLLLLLPLRTAAELLYGVSLQVVNSG